MIDDKISKEEALGLVKLIMNKAQATWSAKLEMLAELISCGTKPNIDNNGIVK